MSSDETTGVIRPGRDGTPGEDGRWWAAHGLGSRTCDLGWYDTEAAAAAAAGRNGRRVVRARPGETGYAALAREDRDALAGHRLAWMRLGHAVEVLLPAGLDAADEALALAAARAGGARAAGIFMSGGLVRRVPDEAGPRDPWVRDPAPGEAWHLELSPAGLVAWDARGCPRYLDDGGQPAWPLTRSRPPAAARRVVACGGMHQRGADCAWCDGTAWEGDIGPPPARRLSAEPVGLAEIARRLGVRPGTARMWRLRGVLPGPPWVVSGQPAWPWSAIAEWAEETGRAVPVVPEALGGSDPRASGARRRKHDRERDPAYAAAAVAAELAARDQRRGYLDGDGDLAVVAADVLAGWLDRAGQGGYPGGLRGWVGAYVTRAEGYAPAGALPGVWAARVARLRREAPGA